MSEVSAEPIMMDVLSARYRIEKPLGKGGQGETFLAREVETGDAVVVKKLSIGSAVDWKAVELFEREGEALKGFSHPAIPAYRDAFYIKGEDSQDEFFLVQEFVDGENFERLLASELQFDVEQARSFLSEMLDILEYLHGQNPPVIHRDIKPSNIMRREEDGRLVLIDFGAAHACFVDDEGGSTIIGTSGYMPIEQLTGRAVPATDLYGLGATVVHLLSRHHPSDLPMKEMALQFHDDVNI